MPTTIHHDDDADLGLIQSRTVAVIGYGEPRHDDQALAHALSLRDSGVDVRLGLPAGGATGAAAADEGLPVLAPAPAVAAADLIMLLAPATAQREHYPTDIAPNLNDGDALLFGHGFTVRFGLVQPPAKVDVAMVTPKAPADQVRAQFVDGRGVPCLVAVHADASGQAWPLALSYARAIGGTKAGALATTFAEATEAELFGEQAVRGGLTALVEAAFEVLTDAGYPPEIAYFACLHELRAVAADLVGGAAGNGDPGSATAEYGASTVGPRVIGPAATDELRRILDEITDGTFAARWADGDHPPAGRHRAVDEAGRTVGALMPWLR